MSDRNIYPGLDPDIGDDSMYCPACGSCGEEGCCPPTKCQLVRCKYGRTNMAAYHRARDEASRWYECLVALGISDPFALTPELAAAIARERSGGRSSAGAIEACEAMLSAMMFAENTGLGAGPDDDRDWDAAIAKGKAALGMRSVGTQDQRPGTRPDDHRAESASA